MARVVVLVPFAFDEKGLANRRAQLASVKLGPEIDFDYRPVKAGPALYDSYQDFMLADVAMYEAGLTAQEDGYDAVCIDTMSDSGVNALRSVLDVSRAERELGWRPQTALAEGLELTWG